MTYGTNRRPATTIRDRAKPPRHPIPAAAPQLDKRIHKRFRETGRSSADSRSQFANSQFANKMRRLILKITFLVAIIISTGGWIWLLGLGIRWLIVKL
jgi:hypothetical protein